MKKEKLYTTDGESLRGYKIGDYYLLKQYTWGNKYNWIVTIQEYSYFNCELMDAIERKECFLVESMKDGIELINKKMEGNI